MTDITRVRLKNSQKRGLKIAELTGYAKVAAIRLDKAITLIEINLTEIHTEQTQHLIDAKPYAQLALSIPGDGKDLTLCLGVLNIYPASIS